nr:uncharacterized protein LOC129256245 [Lytechinus pictus]
MGVRRLICFRRRRWSRYLCLLVFATVIYFIFQGTYLRALNNNSADKLEIDGGDSIKVKHEKSLTILGVRSDDLLHYVPDKDGLFHCIDGSAKVPMMAVNDEYCDCPLDGSDEPGTDACPHARFYCEHNNKFLPSGKVNDGICDCCDGSDEWKIGLGSVKVKGFPLSDVIQHAPCVDTCSKLVDREREDQRVRQIGLRLKQQYIARAQGHLSKNSQDIYGKQGEFYQLSKECFDHADYAASYHICPFHKVEQTQNGHMFKLGSKGQWDTSRVDKLVLVMMGGDGRGCPGDGRRTEIEFSCGLSNSITKLFEEAKCVYTVHFLTPAAC